MELISTIVSRAKRTSYNSINYCINHMIQKIKYILLACFLISGFSISAQSNFEGSWEGVASWGAKKFKMTMKFEQKGTEISGIALTENLNNDNFIKYAFAGEILDGAVFARGIELIEQKGVSHCMPGFAIKFSEEDPNRLVGKWRANKGANSCLVPGFGGMNLQRVGTKPTEDRINAVARSSSDTEKITIAEDDKRGNALSAELKKRKFHGLFIAVQDYSDNSVIDLDNPVEDATALIAELKEEYNFEEEHIVFLKNPDRTTIIETFDKLTYTVQPEDNFLVFYAGHGIWDEQIEQGYWLPSDAKKSSKAAWLSNGTIRDYIRAIDSKHTLLITDACFSGGILKTREAFTTSKAMLEMYKLPSRKAMTSGALKTVPDKSVFIEYLVKALKSNDQPLISADQLFTSFKYNVINNSPNGQVPQYGVISQSDDEGGDFIFLKQ